MKNKNTYMILGGIIILGTIFYFYNKNKNKKTDTSTDDYNNFGGDTHKRKKRVDRAMFFDGGKKRKKVYVRTVGTGQWEV